MHSYTLRDMLDARAKPAADAWIDQAQARFDTVNNDLVLRTASLLNQLVGDAALHPRLINTLSLLEHMGSHKIMATQHGPAIDQATLRHVTEECHHAFFLKRQAEKAAGASLEYADAQLLAPLAARMYFQRLEARMVRTLGHVADTAVIYLYMSMIIEFRAIWFYTMYQRALVRHRHAMSLKRLLGEEQNHLTDMAGRLEQTGELDDGRVDALILHEHALYGRLVDSLHRSVSQA